MNLGTSTPKREPFHENHERIRSLMDLLSAMRKCAQLGCLYDKNNTVQVKTVEEFITTVLSNLQTASIDLAHHVDPSLRDAKS